MRNKWDPSKGATLRTYFIGQCLIRFANVYRGWWRNEGRRRYDVTGDAGFLDDIGPRYRAADVQALDRAAADEALATIKNPRVRTAVVLKAAGRTHTEIAAFLDVTEKAVERMIANERDRQRMRRVG